MTTKGQMKPTSWQDESNSIPGHVLILVPVTTGFHPEPLLHLGVRFLLCPGVVGPVFVLQLYRSFTRPTNRSLA